MKKILKISFIILTIGWFAFIGFGFVVANFFGETREDLAFNETNYSCELKNGKYKVVYDKEFSQYPKWEFELNGKNVTKINSDIKRKYELEKIGANSFRLNSLEKKTDSLTEIQKALISQGKSYYEITDCKKDTFEFTMRVNLHVISNSGKFIKVE